MSDDLRARIATVIASHVYNEWHADEAEQCMCGKCGTSYPAHVADELTAELYELRGCDECGKPHPKCECLR